MLSPMHKDRVKVGICLAFVCVVVGVSGCMYADATLVGLDNKKKGKKDIADAVKDLNVVDNAADIERTVKTSKNYDVIKEFAAENAKKNSNFVVVGSFCLPLFSSPFANSHLQATSMPASPPLWAAYFMT
jgi:hypothetical protein